MSKLTLVQEKKPKSAYMQLSEEEKRRMNRIDIDRRENRERKNSDLALKRKAKQRKY